MATRKPRVIVSPNPRGTCYTCVAPSAVLTLHDYTRSVPTFRASEESEAVAYFRGER